jgi:hypothetical protein
VMCYRSGQGGVKRGCCRLCLVGIRCYWGKGGVAACGEGADGAGGGRVWRLLR